MKFIGSSLLFVLMAVGPLNVNYPQVAQACSSESYISVGKLFDYCHAPGECGKVLACEGQIVQVKGVIDYDNVFEHSHYPQLPYEKFFLAGDGRNKIDVLAVSPDNASLFKKIFAARLNGKKRAYIKTTIKGIDFHVMGTCRREIGLEINSPEDISLR